MNIEDFDLGNPVDWHWFDSNEQPHNSNKSHYADDLGTRTLCGTRIPGYAIVEGTGYPHVTCKRCSKIAQKAERPEDNPYIDQD